MPEYLAPGVFVEETSYRSKVIEGVSTTTTGLIGPCRYGPTQLRPELVTSLFEFERVYGGGAQLEYNAGATKVHNYLWHAARAFFAEGGKRLYVSRVFQPRASGSTGVATGHLANQPAPSPTERAFSISARFPGQAGNLRVRFTLRAGANVLSFGPAPSNTPRVGALNHNDVVLIRDASAPETSPPGSAGTFYLATVDAAGVWTFTPATGSALVWTSFTPADGIEIRVVTITVTIEPPPDVSHGTLVYNDLALHATHLRNGSPDSLAEMFRVRTEDPDYGRELPISIDTGNVTTGLALASSLLLASSTLLTALADPRSTDLARSVTVTLTGGDDGIEPPAANYQGTGDPSSPTKTGLKQFEDLENISIVAAPGSTRAYSTRKDDADAIISHLISHATRMRYRIAVIDSGEGQSPGQVRETRARFDSSYAALYYPWVRVLDPITGQPVFMPPSGFVAGIYARNDVNRAVYKAPANEVVNLALGFELSLNTAQQEVLNPDGINCFRSFEGRGHRLWGARTMSSDGEWKYVNLRRYFAYVEHSVDRGTQWAVFEPNGDALWANVRRSIEDFLFDEWRSGALLGDKPEKAYFVKCDRSTMSQNDLDNGRLVCLVGLATLRPAEFVIIRIGQWTGDRRN
jgi:phage tail sheath protein FI